MSSGHGPSELNNSEIYQTKSMLMKQPAVFIPEITRLPVFGDPNQSVDLEFPKL